MDLTLYLPLVIGAALATLGFAVSVNLPYRCLPYAMLVGVAGRLVSQGADTLGHSEEFAAFAAGLTVGLLAEVGARRFRTPYTLFAITGFIPLVPGTMAFRAMKEFLDSQFVPGLVLLLRVVLVGGSIAAGIGAAVALNQRRRRP